MGEVGREEIRKGNFGHVAMTPQELRTEHLLKEVFVVLTVLKQKRLKSREVHQVSQGHTAEPTVQPGRSEDVTPGPRGQWLKWGREALRIEIIFSMVTLKLSLFWH